MVITVYYKPWHMDVDGKYIIIKVRYSKSVRHFQTVFKPRHVHMNVDGGCHDQIR